MAMAWEKDLKPIFRPEDVHMGKMKVDTEKCTGCGLCIENCLFRSWEMGDDNVSHYKEGWACFSYYNCMVAVQRVPSPLMSRTTSTQGSGRPSLINYQPYGLWNPGMPRESPTSGMKSRSLCLLDVRYETSRISQYPSHLSGG